MVISQLFPEINYELLTSPILGGRADHYLRLACVLFSQAACWLYFEIGALVKEINFLKVFVLFISQHTLVELRLVMLTIGIIVIFIFSLWWAHFLGCSLLYQRFIQVNEWALPLVFTNKAYIFVQTWHLLAIIELAWLARCALGPLLVPQILVFRRLKWV